MIFASSTAAVAFSLYGTTYKTVGECLRYASFQTASIITTTGFATVTSSNGRSSARSSFLR